MLLVTATLRPPRDLGFDLQIHVVAGIEEAEIDLGTLEHEPVQAVPMPPESKDGDDTLVGERVDAHHPPQRPHEKIGIEILVGEIFRRPPVTPCAERIDHGTELATSSGQAILVTVTALCGKLLDDPASLQRLQSLREEIPGHSRDATLDVTESPAANEQLAQNEWRPALGEDLGPQGNGAKLTIVSHDAKVGSAPEKDKSNF